MKKEAYDFVTRLVNTNKLGSKISRAQIIRHMIITYKPKSKNSKIHGYSRYITDTVLREFMSCGILKRAERGIYEIIKKPNERKRKNS